MLVYLQMIETEEDSSKFEAIYREYRDLLLFLADRRLRNPQDAEDAVHEVFVKLAENIRRIEPVSARTKRLVTVMLENTMTDLLRRKSRHPDTELADEPEQPGPEEEGSLLEDCILRLPERQRAVIWLKYDQGHSLREVAKLLGISLANAQKLDQRAKKKLEAYYWKGVDAK